MAAAQEPLGADAEHRDTEQLGIRITGLDTCTIVHTAVRLD